MLIFESALDAFAIKRTEFCYAGLWSGLIDLSTGLLRRCYGCNVGVQNIFDDVNQPIEFEPVGTHCREHFCVNSDLFLAIGNIPEYEIQTITALHDRAEAHWYSDEMAEALNGRLWNIHSTYTDVQKGKNKRKMSYMYDINAFFNAIKERKDVIENIFYSNACL